MAEEKKPREESEILEQLRELGQNLEAVIRKAWESDQGKQMREQFSSGLQELNNQVNHAVESVKANEDAQKLHAKAQEQWKTARGDETAETLRRGVRDALKSLNQQISKLVETTPSDSASKEQNDKPTH